MSSFYSDLNLLKPTEDYFTLTLFSQAEIEQAGTIEIISFAKVTWVCHVCFLVAGETALLVTTCADMQRTRKLAVHAGIQGSNSHPLAVRQES